MSLSHHLHESRSLRMHRLVAEHFRQDPGEVTRFALENLHRWRRQGLDCEDFGTWENLLSGEPNLLVQMLTGTDDEAVRLRQSSPFAGLIPESSRKRILASRE